MKKFGGDKKYIYIGMTAFAVIACGMLLYMLLMRWSAFVGDMAKLLHILSPFIWGFVIAYLLRPLIRFFETRLMGPLGARIFPKHAHRAFIFGRAAALILSEAALVLIVLLLLWLVLPQLYSSIESIVLNVPNYYDTVVSWAAKVLENYPQLEETFVNTVAKISDSLVDWAETSLLPQMTSIVTNITSGVYYFVRGIYYVVVGLIASFYILFNKEAVSTGTKKLAYCVFSVGMAEKVLDGFRFTDRIFMGFISGKIVDSAIIGVLCYIGCAILGIPYPILVSVIVGVTNVIPFFGPLIGAVPSAIIILMVSPLKCVIFVIFVFLLQQLDGNVIGPKILGESIGINGFWVMFAIILGTGLFGFAGMVLGVPVFVILYTAINHFMDRKLKRSGLPTETASYVNLHHFDPSTNEPVEKPPEAGPAERRAFRSAARAAKKKRGGENGAEDGDAGKDQK